MRSISVQKTNVYTAYTYIVYRMAARLSVGKRHDSAYSRYVVCTLQGRADRRFFFSHNSMCVAD